MSRVTRTHQADVDLDDIWLHVAMDSPAAADKLIDRIVETCEALAAHPNPGPVRREIAPDLRMLVIGQYLVLYRVRNEGVQVARVVHGARRLEGLFDDIEGDP